VVRRSSGQFGHLKEESFVDDTASKTGQSARKVRRLAVRQTRHPQRFGAVRGCGSNRAPAPDLLGPVDKKSTALAFAGPAVGQCARPAKANLPHGEWLPWLEANASVLGFESRFTAAKLIRLANVPPAAHFDEATAVAVSRHLCRCSRCKTGARLREEIAPVTAEIRSEGRTYTTKHGTTGTRGTGRWSAHKIAFWEPFCQTLIPSRVFGATPSVFPLASSHPSARTPAGKLRRGFCNRRQDFRRPAAPSSCRASLGWPACLSWWLSLGSSWAAAAPPMTPSRRSETRFRSGEA
jgi:hypothetical protein